MLIVKVKQDEVVELTLPDTSKIIVKRAPHRGLGFLCSREIKINRIKTEEPEDKAPLIRERGETKNFY